MIAHEASGRVNWTSLENDIAILHAALQALGLACERPQLAFFSERIPIDKPDHPGALFEFRYVFGVKEGDRVAAQVEHKEYVMKDGA